MKTILLMRHAKSDWGDPSLEDFDRPLNERGKADAPRMGKALARLEAVPDRIVASPARRSRESAEAVAKAVGRDVTLDRSLYAAAGEAWLAALARLPEKTGTVLVVGHVPGVEEAFALLTGGAGGRAAARARFATSAVACLATDIDRWSAIEPGCAEIRWMIGPKQVKAFV